MPPRSLRRGDKCPNPGAVHKGCSRPKVLRFDSPLGGDSVLGTGQYSGNIIQGGVVLQPQAYLLDGITPLSHCIVVTGAATVAPDATTLASVYSCQNLVITGASASLAASTNSKGLLGFVRGHVVITNGGSIHMDSLGLAGNFGNVTIPSLIPTTLLKHIRTEKLAAYVLLGEGAAGAPACSRDNSYNNGVAAGPMQTGGGGTGRAGSGTAGAGGKGGPCCGGAGSGGAVHKTSSAAGAYGGPGGAGNATTYSGGGGAGNPPGAGSNGGAAALGGGGGVVGLFAPSINIAAGAFIRTNGANGGTATYAGGGAGGGCVVIVTSTGGLTNAGTICANGGAGGGLGGVGSVNTFEIAI